MMFVSLTITLVKQKLLFWDSSIRKYTCQCIVLCLLVIALSVILRFTAGNYTMHLQTVLIV